MDAETLTALKQSIKKWERNAVASRPSAYTTSPRTCALCKMFSDDECLGCPVNKRTGKTGCHDTPYTAAREAKYAWLSAPENETLRDAAHAAARAEADFLRSLLPEGEDR